MLGVTSRSTLLRLINHQHQHGTVTLKGAARGEWSQGYCRRSHSTTLLNNQNIWPIPIISAILFLYAEGDHYWKPQPIKMHSWGGQSGWGPLQKRGHNLKSEIIREIVYPSKCQKLCRKVSSTCLTTEDEICPGRWRTPMRPQPYTKNDRPLPNAE